MRSKTTKEVVERLHYEDPQEVCGRVIVQGVSVPYNGRWINTYRVLDCNDPETNIYAIYTAMFNGKEANAVLANQGGLWHLGVVCGSEITRKVFKGIYIARDAAYTMVWARLGMTPPEEVAR